MKTGMPISSLTDLAKITTVTKDLLSEKDIETLNKGFMDSVLFNKEGYEISKSGNIRLLASRRIKQHKRQDAMTVLEQRYMETMPIRLKCIEDQLKELNRNMEQLIKLLKNENKV